MSEENKEPAKETPPPASAEVTPAPAALAVPAAEVPPVPATPAQQAPVEGPRKILQELEKAAAALEPIAVAPAEPTPAEPEPAPAQEASPQSSGMPLITDNMRRLDDLLARFR